MGGGGCARSLESESSVARMKAYNQAKHQHDTGYFAQATFGSFMFISSYAQVRLGLGGSLRVQVMHCASCDTCILFTAIQVCESDG